MAGGGLFPAAGGCGVCGGGGDGCLLAALTVRFSLMDALFSPLLRIIKAAPVASFIILALVWIRTDALPAFIAYLMVVPVVWANVEKGIRETDRKLLEMAQVYRFGWWRTLLRVRLPAVMPYFMAACTTGWDSPGNRGSRRKLSAARPCRSASSYRTPRCIWRRRRCSR